MKQLEHLDLSYSGFNGSVPHQLGNLTSLVYLDLSKNDLLVDGLHWLTRLSNLQFLDLSYMDLSRMENLIRVLNRLPSLSELQLEGCGLENRHLKSVQVNSTMDESLLCQGLALNDDLQCVLAKHEALASGTAIQQPKPKPESVLFWSIQEKAANRLIPGEDFSSPAPQDSLALVPVSAPQPSNPVPSEQNALALVDMFSSGNNAPSSSNPQPAFHSGQIYLAPPQFQQQQQHLQSQQPSSYQNGFATSTGFPCEQTAYPQAPVPSWNTQTVQQQQSSSPGYAVQLPSSPSYGAENGGALPPPPWESQPDNNPQYSSLYPAQMHLNAPQLGPQMGGNDPVVGMYMQPIPSDQLSTMNNMQAHQMPGVYPQHLQGQQMMGMPPHMMQMQAGQMAQMHPSHMYGNQMAGYGYGYGYGQQPDTQSLENRMYGLSMKNESASYQNSTSSYLPPMKQQSKAEEAFRRSCRYGKV